MKRLHQLRLYFILYIVIRILIDVFYGKEIIINTFRSFTPFSISQYISSPGIFYVIIFFTYVFTFIIGLILFHYLIEKKSWARILLLITGWLAVIDAVSGVLVQHQISGILNYIDKEINWKQIFFLDRVTDFLGLIFWGSLIYILQFNRNIKQIFI